MARGVNKVIVLGNCVRDPEVKYMPSGGAVTNISVATSEQWTDKASGQKQERTEYHRITLFNRLGEIAAEYLKKGSQAYIEGSLRTDEYQDKQTGEDRYSTGIIASNMQLLGGRGDAPQHSQQSQQSAPQGQSQGQGGGAMSDDMLFNALPSYP